MAPGSGRFAGFSGRERGQSGVDTGVFWIVGRDDPEVVPGISFSHKAGVSSSTTNLRDQFTGRSRGKESSSLCTAPEHGGRREIDDSRYIFRKSSTDDLPGKTSGTHTPGEVVKKPRAETSEPEAGRQKNVPADLKWLCCSFGSIP